MTKRQLRVGMIMEHRQTKQRSIVTRVHRSQDKVSISAIVAGVPASNGPPIPIERLLTHWRLATDQRTTP